MAGIYIHIPFCKQACHYCNFHFATSLHYKPELVRSIITEIGLQKNYPEGETVDTIYFGGGTPSLLDDNELNGILSAIREFFSVASDAELTLEANPDDISEAKLIAWKKAGINRLSIGIQSFFEEDLRWMNRAHTAEQAKENLELAIQFFNNITIDLIYGTPQLTDAKWKQNVDMAIAMGIPHLSCYALTVETKTPLQKMIEQRLTAGVDPDKQSAQFLLLMDWAEKAGYEHYEISNFAMPGKQSRHNSSYWAGKKYLGIGPSAHSYNGQSRQWNIANNNVYVRSVSEGKIPAETETLSSIQQLNEYIMISLRTGKGINLDVLSSRFGIEKKSFIDRAKKHIDNGLAIVEEESLRLTKQGKLLADGIAADLFY